MEELLSKIYDQVVYFEPDAIELSKKFAEEVSGLVAPLREAMSEDELENVKSMIYSATYSSQKHGFCLGVHAAVKVLLEAANILDESE